MLSHHTYEKESQGVERIAVPDEHSRTQILVSGGSLPVKVARQEPKYPAYTQHKQGQLVA